MGLPALGWGQGGLSLWGWGCRGQRPSLTLLVPLHRPCEPPRQGVPAAGAGACRGPGLVRVQGAPARPAVRHLPQRQLGASHHPWCVVCGTCACMRACLVCVLRVHEPPPHAPGTQPLTVACPGDPGAAVPQVPQPSWRPWSGPLVRYQPHPGPLLVLASQRPGSSWQRAVTMSGGGNWVLESRRVEHLQEDPLQGSPVRAFL